jgi:hypothetical protein
MAEGFAMRLIAIFIGVCVAAGVVPLFEVDRGDAPVEQSAFPGWPETFEGAALTPLELTEIERGFESGFPGRMGRFTDGRRTIVLRWIAAPTRRLHPASDCYRGSGYTVRPEPIYMDDMGARWGCFEACRRGERLLVRERIVDAEGNAWSDASSWYWAALLGRSEGPWWAVTVATRIVE